MNRTILSITALALLAGIVLAPGNARGFTPVTGINGDQSYVWGWMGSVDNDFMNSNNWYDGQNFPGVPSLGDLPVQLGPFSIVVNGALDHWQLPVNVYPALNQSITSPDLTLVSYDQVNSLTFSNGANYTVTGVTTVGCSYLASVTSLLPPGEPAYYSGSYPGGSPIAASLTLTNGAQLNTSTLVAVGMGIAGLGGYIRHRRMVAK